MLQRLKADVEELVAFLSDCLVEQIHLKRLVNDDREATGQRSERS